MSINNTDFPDEIICSCSGTTRAEIETLFKKGMDVDAISRWTGALSGCAGCESDISKLIQALSEQNN